MGLAIAKEIMERHGRRISVESEILKGTKMTLHFLKNPEKKRRQQYKSDLIYGSLFS